MSALTPAIRSFIVGEPSGVLGTTRPDGRPRLSVVRHLLDDDRVLISTEVTRAKARDVARDGFAFNLDVAQIIHVGALDAPKVISRVGSMQNLVDHVLQPVAQPVQTVGTLTISHGRALKRYAVGRSAPTGHSSVTLPENALPYGRSSNVAMTLWLPRSRATSSPSSATSDEKRVHR